MLREAKKMGKVRIVAVQPCRRHGRPQEGRLWPNASWWRGWGRDVPGRGRDLRRSALHL